MLFITFVTRRVERDEVVLPPEVYVDRKAQYERRITSMIQYATDNELCHSRFLLRYFGEENTAKCGRCDICLGEKSSQDDEPTIRAAILRQLQEGSKAPRDIDVTGFNREHFADVLESMIRQEEILLDTQQHFYLNPHREK